RDKPGSFAACECSRRNGTLTVAACRHPGNFRVGESADEGSVGQCCSAFDRVPDPVGTSTIRLFLRPYRGGIRRLPDECPNEMAEVAGGHGGPSSRFADWSSSTPTDLGRFERFVKSGAHAGISV